MQPCSSQVQQSWILITASYLWLNPQHGPCEDILEAAQVSATEGRSCFILGLLAQQGTRQKEFPLRLSALLHFLTDIDCSPLPTLKYSPRTFAPSALSTAVLPCIVPVLPSPLSLGSGRSGRTHTLGWAEE